MKHSQFHSDSHNFGKVMRLLVLVVVTTLVFLISSPAEGIQNFNNSKSGFSISIPDDWIEIPYETMKSEKQELAEELKKPIKIIPEKGYQQKSSEWFSYPYILINNHKGRLPEKELASIEKMDMGFVNDDINKKISPMGQVYLSKPTYDEKNNILWIRGESIDKRHKVPKNINIISAVFPTEVSTKEVSCFSEKQIAKDFDVCLTIIRSVRISEKIKYRPSLNWKDYLPRLFQKNQKK